MIEIEEPSEKSVVMKTVADNPSAFLIRRDNTACFKDYDKNQKLSFRDSRIIHSGSRDVDSDKDN